MSRTGGLAGAAKMWLEEKQRIGQHETFFPFGHARGGPDGGPNFRALLPWMYGCLIRILPPCVNTLLANESVQEPRGTCQTGTRLTLRGNMRLRRWKRWRPCAARAGARPVTGTLRGFGPRVPTGLHRFRLHSPPPPPRQMPRGRLKGQ